MATLISIATGNWLDASSWGVVDSTSLLDAENGNDALTTAYSGTRTQGFTPGAITIDGIAIKLYSVSASPTGTISVHLITSSDNVEVSGTEVVLNVSDLPASNSAYNEGGWVFFKFASPVTLSAATEYKMESKTSSTSQVNLYRNSTTDNSSRMLRTTTTQAPAAGDILHVMGEHTGAGTGNDFTVTMNNTATTDYGAGSNNVAALTISKRGTLTSGVADSTDYYLKLSGDLVGYRGGTLNIGTTSTPIPRTSTFVLEFDPTTDNGMGLITRKGFTINIQGLSRSSGKNIVKCLLNTDEAANSTSLGVDTDTGWLDNDAICIAPTTRTYSQHEQGTLNGNAGASSLTVDGFGGTGGGLAYAHEGTDPVQAEIGLLTRNIKIRSTSSSVVARIIIADNVAADIDWAEIYYMGGISIYTELSDSLGFNYCSFHDFESNGLGIASTSGLYQNNNINISDNVFYKMGVTGSTYSGGSLTVSKTSNSSITINNNLFIYGSNGYNSGGVVIGDVGITFTNNVIAGYGLRNPGASALAIGEDGAVITGDFSGNVVHSCYKDGLSLGSKVQPTKPMIGTISGIKVYRCNSYGVVLGMSNPQLSAASAVVIDDLILDDFELFGNTTGNIFATCSPGSSPYATLGFIGSLTLKNFLSHGDSTFATTNGLIIDTVIADLKMINCDFSTASGIKTAHTNDIKIQNDQRFARLSLINTKLSASVEVLNQSYLSQNSFISSQKHDQTAGNHKTWKKYGTISIDTSIYRTASPSQCLTPISASGKLESGSFKVNVNNGQTCTPSVYVRESVSGDGTDYNGNRPRLILKANQALGITSDTVIDTATASAEGAFEQLTGTTSAVTDDGVLEFVIDCDGTTGWINIDDISATVT